MNLLRVLAVIGAATLPAWAQYAGPAILTRGQAPTGISASTISFRPFIEFTGVYDTGLAGVGVVDPQGHLANEGSLGVEFAAGVSGSHRWRRTSVGLDYRGAIRHYSKSTYYDGVDQSLLLGINHQFSRHVTLTLRENAGMLSRDFGLVGLQQSVPFDPGTSYVPTTDFFDNRVLYLSSQTDLTYQRSARLSFNIGGDYFTAKRRSAALFGITGQSARSDVQYRVRRYTTIGLNYTFGRFAFSRGFGNTVIHSVAATYSVRLSRTVELSAYGGVGRAETKFIQAIPIDPVVAAIIGQSTGLAVRHRIDTIPNIGGRLSRTFRTGVVWISGSHFIVPGNGLFLTSAATNVGGGYSYNGVRRWSFGLSLDYNNSQVISNVVGNYGSYSGGIHASRTLLRYVHFVSRVEARRYTSADFGAYRRNIYRATIGIGFAPGEVPLRIW